MVLPDPMHGNADKEILYLRVGGVPLGHIIADGKTLVVDFLLVYRIPVDDEPVKVF